MAKHSLRKSFKSFFQSHVDPNKDDQLRGTKSEIEGKVQQILNILKTEDDKDKDGKEKLVGMIEDFQNQYRSLFDRYDHLTEALRRRAHARRGKDSSSSSSDSDSDSDGSLNLRISDDNAKQELEIAYSLVKENETTKYSTEMEQLKHENEVLQLELQEKREAISVLEEENNSLSSQISQLEDEIKQLANTRAQETSECLLQIETLKGEFAKKSLEFVTEIGTFKEELMSKILEQQETLEERENFAVMVKDLELKIDSLSNLKDEMEEQLRTKSQDVIQLQEEKEKLKVRNGDLDEQASGLQEEGNKLKEEKAVQERKNSELQNEAAIQITALSEEVNRLLHENVQLQSEKSILEVEIERSKRESIENLAQLENQNVELQNKIRDLEEKLTEEDELRFQNSEENVNSKMEEIIEGLKRDLEMKEDEVNTLVENLRNTEVKHRLTSQKLRITEQSLTEKEESQNSKEDKLQEEKKLLKNKVEAYKKVQLDVAKEITEKVNDIMTGFDSFNVKFEECYGRSEFRLYEVVNKIGFVRNWIKESTCEKGRLKREISNYIHQLKDEKEQGLLLRAKVEDLETRLQKDENEKDELTEIVKQGKEKMTELERMIQVRDAKMGELEREMNKKEVGILSLAEQKREAIKQLCIWIEYHRNRYDDLISKTARGRRQIAA